MSERFSIGRHLHLRVRGTSHAPQISFRLEGFPADFPIDEGALAGFMARRAPGRDALSTARQEPDALELARREDAIGGVIRNVDTRPHDYDVARSVPRPGHADFGQWVEMGRIPTGGGANSGRLTVALCAAGGICKQWLAHRGIAVDAYVERIGTATEAAQFESAVLAAKAAGDSVGGTIACRITGVKPGLGGALFDGLESALAQAIFAIPGVKGIAFGNGFDAATLRGSQNNDAFVVTEDGAVCTATNRHGGILGGRTTGMPITFTVALKPTPTIFNEQDSVDLATGKPAKLAMKGRHDPCIVLRAIPVVEAMAAFVLADALLEDEAARPRICLTLTGKTLAEDMAQYQSQRLFTDMVELRVDLLAELEREHVESFVAQLDVPVIFTFRRKIDGGVFEGDEAVRRDWFRQHLACGTYVDFEVDFQDASLTTLAHKAGVKIVRSLHDFTGKPKESLDVLCRRLRRATDEIPKIAFMPKDMEDVCLAFEETQGFRDIPHIICAMGPMGLATRILACMTGSMLTYTSVGGLEDIGHITPHELVRTYRFRALTESFALYGVTGWPLKATRSPELNNLAWADADEDRVMIPFPSKDANEALSFMRAMDMRGLAVTIPHKQAIMSHVHRLDATAQAVGAVNTIACASHQCAGYNTDAEGFSTAIRHFMGRDDFSGLRVAVLGAGGAAKAVIYTLRQLHAHVETFHRATPPRGYDLLVNATPVDPIPDYAFTGKEAVYDLVYVPALTPLLARAQAAGCRIENGFSMLVAQAAAQRRIWQ